MVLPGLGCGGQATGSDWNIRHLRNRDVVLQAGRNVEVNRERPRSDIGVGNQRAGLAHVRTRALSEDRNERQQQECDNNSVSQQSIRSRGSRRSIQLRAQLEEMEAEIYHQRRLNDLQRQAEEREHQRLAQEREHQRLAQEREHQRLAQERENQRLEEELRLQHELEKVRRELRRASQAGSKVGSSFCSARSESPQQRTSSWVQSQVEVPSNLLAPPTHAPVSNNLNFASAVPSVSFRPPEEVRFNQPPVNDNINPDPSNHMNVNDSNQPVTPSWESYIARKTAGKLLPSFNGDPTEWLNFISAFRRTTLSCKYSQEENMNRLNQVLSGKARDSVKSLLAVPNAVEEILQTLELQFGRPIVILNNLVDKIRKFPRLAEDNPQAIVQFSVQITNLVVAIERLGNVQYLSNPQLLDEIVFKLNPSFKLQWGEYVVKELGGVANLSHIKCWLHGKALGAAHVASSSVTRPYARSDSHVNFVKESSSGSDKLLKNLVCYYCKDKHGVRNCPTFKNLSVNDRRLWVKENKLCFSCLSKDHRVNKCRNRRKCGVDGCKGNHSNLLHMPINNEGNVADRAEVIPDRVHNIVSHSFVSNNVLLKILPVRIKGPKGDRVVSALLDEGANCSLIDTDLADDLGLCGNSEPLCIQWIKNETNTEENSRCLDLRVSGVKQGSRSYTLSRVRTVQGLNLPCQLIDTKELSKLWPRSARICLSENPGPPKLLIGQNNWSVMETFRSINQCWNGLVLSKTRLGWVLHGNVGKSDNSNEILRPLHVCQVEVNDEALHHMVKEHFSLENLGPTSNEHMLSQDESRAMSIVDSTARLIDGRWEVGLLWKYDKENFVDSYPSALQRLYCVEKKLDRDPRFAEQYCQKMNEYVLKGYARKLHADEIECNSPRLWFLPHLGVFNPNKPGKIRVCFDASAKVNGVSLNSRLLKGPDLFNSIPEILMRFRKGKIAFVGDIREMYLQIKIRKEDQVAQRFLWRGMDRNRTPDQFVMSSMIFGPVCSPFEAQEIRNRNSLRFQSSYPRAVEAICKNHYMDDYLDSVDSDEEAIGLIKDVIMIHQYGSFDMVNWVSNSTLVLNAVQSILKEPVENLLDSHHSEKVLGLKWIPIKDTFVFRLNWDRIPLSVREKKRGPTKREFLRIVMGVFDPLGFLGWFFINAKILLQDIWRSKTDWDEEISDSLKPRWFDWLQNLSKIERLEIPRCYSPFLSRASTLELHTFCDASDRAYAALCYLRIVTDSQISLSLMASRTRVAPLKQLSVPRLELQAAVLGCRIVKTLRKALGLTFDREYFWSDSKTVLHWISHHEVRYRMFVAHRLGEIIETSDPNQWRWTPGMENPADDGTKWQTGNSERWFTGPEFLYYPENRWPQTGEILTGSAKELEVLEQVNLVVVGDTSASSLPDIRRFSNYLRLVRATAWLLRFIRHCKGDNREQKVLALTTLELQLAEEKWWKQVQKEDFSQEIADLERGLPVSKGSKLYRLSPFLDEAGILRVQGRIDRAKEIPLDVKKPVILDSKNRFVSLLIDFYHKTASHQGQEYVANELRQKYWILGLRRAVRSSWHRCQKCAKYRTRPLQQPMAPLPADRLNHHTRPFSFVGLDYFGPLYVSVKRTKEKRYGAVFSCLTTRAIHLELVNNLTTDCTILAIRRMASRRGCPIKIWSDNGTNFRGADKEIRECLRLLDTTRIEDELASRGIQWNFLPPSAPHMGGSWERLIRSVKRALLVTMKSMAPKEDVLVTLLTEAEHLVNSRPLTRVSEDPADPEALTPNHFLIGSSSGLCPWTAEGQALDLRKRWQLAQRLTDLFWHRWVREYLPSLVKRTKWYRQGCPIQVGQLVYLVDPKKPRGNWQPAKILATFPGKDGNTRVVDVQTREGIKRRPITSLLPLFPHEE